MADPHPLLALYLAAADGIFPPADGSVRIVPPLAKGFEASIGFTGHAVIATAWPAARVLEQGVDAFGGSLAPRFLSWLAGDGGQIGSLDLTLVARGSGRSALPRRSDLDAHPRVRHARHERAVVEVYGDERGLVTLARGLGGRRELSIEVASDAQGAGLGRALLCDALGLVPRGAPVFAAVASGNARSLRCFLAVGFLPLGCEVVLLPRRE